MLPPVFNGGDVGDVEDGDDRDDVTPAQELVNRLEDHPPEQEDHPSDHSDHPDHPPDYSAYFLRSIEMSNCNVQY